VFQRCSFVAVTTKDLDRARRFWVDALGFRVTEEDPGHHFIVDAGGLRLCVDLEDGDAHRAGGTDPIVGMKVASLAPCLAALAARGVRPVEGPVRGKKGSWARFVDPDGHGVVVAEFD
jgi:catechol 2,3-dioxygenase-like lactoylglutathione lyase family enzyme